jgi:hypothetical protein
MFAPVFSVRQILRCSSYVAESILFIYLHSLLSPDIPEKAAQAEELRSLVAQLPVLNQEILRELLNFLRFMSINSSVNKMGYDNLGLVWVLLYDISSTLTLAAT